MEPPEQIPYHEGLTELLEMKRTMTRTVWRYCLIGLGLALLVAAFITFLNSSIWADLRETLRYR